MKAVIIRHGETEHNKDGSITGQLDIELTNLGIQQAEKVAERLKNKNFTAAYSSDLERTYQTTEIVAKKHNLQPEACKEFRERSYGDYEGNSKDNWRDVVRKHGGNRQTLSSEKGESLQEVGERFVGKLNEIKKRHQSEIILVGSHGVAIKALLMKILNLKGDEYNKLEQDNTGVTELEFNEGKGWRIISMNDTAHLE
mgnify:FL=1